MLSVMYNNNYPPSKYINIYKRFTSYGRGFVKVRKNEWLSGSYERKVTESNKE